MCGIAGIISSSQRQIGKELMQMLQSMQHRGPDGAGYVIDNTLRRGSRIEDLSLQGRKGYVGLGHVRLSITGEHSAFQPFQSDDGKLSLLHNGEIYNYKNIRADLKNPDAVQTNSDSEVILRYIEENYNGDLTDTVKTLLHELDGVYALAISDGNKTIIARDKVGVRQLYYCSTDDHIAFASEKKPIYKLAGKEADIHRLPPGHMMTFEKSEGHSITDFFSLDELKVAPALTGINEAMAAYDKAIMDAVKKRVMGRDRVGIIFSGGIDSLLIAYLVKKLGVPFTCYTAGRGKNASDIEWARKLAEEFDFPIQTKILSADDIESLVPEIIRDIEDQSLNQVEVAIPIYASVRMAQEQGERVILTGQGADELFGGYPWYPKLAEKEGYDSFVKHSFEDTYLLYKECLEREDKISMAHSLELRVPFLDPGVIKVAFQIAPELKIQKGSDLLCKRIHRSYCQSIGIPDNIANRVKEAAQHGAGIHSTFDEIAHKNSPEEQSLQEAGYNSEKTVSEILGSSSRYGFRFGDEHMWKPSPCVQYYLDSVALDLGLLPEAAEDHLHEVRNNLTRRS